jgi:protein tyrosine/serine phosphatase
LLRENLAPSAPTFGTLLEGLTDPNGTPAVIQWTAGKDRTGVSVAVLLSVLEVDEPTILDDCELSAV